MVKSVRLKVYINIQRDLLVEPKARRSFSHGFQSVVDDESRRPDDFVQYGKMVNILSESKISDCFRKR